MLYLNKEDSKILFDTNEVLYELFQAGLLSSDQEKVLARFYKLRQESEVHSNRCRNKAKKFVQEKRKTDKTYAHTRNIKNAKA